MRWVKKKNKKTYLSLQIFQVAFLVQSHLRHVFEKISYLEAAQLDSDVLIQRQVVRI